MKVLDVGHGARQVVRHSRHGVVHSVFSRATYLRLETRSGPALVALTGPTAPSGPVHLRCLALGRHRPGQMVLAAADRLLVGGVVYDLRAPVWQPEPVPAAELDAGRPVLIGATARLPMPDLYLTAGTADGQKRCLPTGLVEAVRRGDLASARDLVSGRGPGLTPTGDDVLAGLLVFATGVWGSAGHGRTTTAGNGAATGEIAATFLHWAGRGSCIEPLHELLAAAAGGDQMGAHQAVHRLSAIGASSGLDLAYGARLAAQWLPARPDASQEVAGEWTQSSLAVRRPGLVHDSGRLAST